MTDKVLPGGAPASGAPAGESVSVHTKKIFDSCRDKDCVEDLRLYLTSDSQRAVEGAVSVRARSARLLYADVDVDEVTFNRGYYSVDIRYFYRIQGEAFTLVGKPAEIAGLAVFDKRVILFGSESSAKIFSSVSAPGGAGPDAPEYSGLPAAVVEAVDPIVLAMKLVDAPDSGCELGVSEIPAQISGNFGGDLVFDGAGRRVYVTLGQFSIVRLERDTQLLIPSYDYFIPDKECLGTGDDDACALFSRIHFPVDEFFPPDTLEAPEGYREARGKYN
ncbi:MAG: hypothetical protein LBD49_06110 [Oscillospiraceae bacterium]|jgi:hypothetical protein|nr:hypothetical protein [Oscillospiraceae bacterium]